MGRGIISATLVGVEAEPVAVEVDLAGGLPLFTLVGLAEAAVREANVRVRSALKNTGFSFPSAGRVSVNLAPANLRKSGTGFDLPIALGLLVAQGVFDEERLRDTLVVGELSLSGDVRPVCGVLAAAEAAARSGARRMLVAQGNAEEASHVSAIEVRGVRTLREAVAFLRDGQEQAAPITLPSTTASPDHQGYDLCEVRGQPAARRALEVAAAGGHNLLFCGGPGSGKTMLASRLPSILPPLALPEALEVTRVHSAAGLLQQGGLLRARPFRAPHHSTSPAGLVGGGAGLPRPGEISLAHRGVLFLDELPEFSKSTLEVLRQPLETGSVFLSRAFGSVRFPASTMLVAAMNPCPCGYAGTGAQPCRCGPMQLTRYRARLSGPLLDRIDVYLSVPPVDLAALEGEETGESSAVVRARVIAARERQADRLGSGRCNAQMGPAELRRDAPLDDDGRRLFRMAVDRFALSARAWERTVKVARTIADLDASAHVEARHVAEALHYREASRLG